MRKKTHEEYVEELKVKNPTVEVIGKYVDSHTKIMHKCLNDGCGYEWEAAPNNIIRGRGCPKCNGKINRTNEDYINQVSLIHPNIIVLGTYKNNITPILHKCIVHNFEWDAYPCNILSGHGCPKCRDDKLSNERKKSQEEYIEDVKSINGNIEVVGKYINAHTPIIHKCLNNGCGYEWMAKPNNILAGKGCPMCYGRMLKSNDEYIKEIHELNPDIEVVGAYVNAKTPIEHRCKICNHTWIASPTNVLNGTGCPICHESSGERRIRQWLDNNGVLYVFQKIFDDCRDKNPLPFDFYLPEHNMCIEYNGGQHYFPVEHFGGQEAFELRVKHDEIKMKYCKDNNIRLLVIPYDKDVNEELNNFLFI